MTHEPQLETPTVAPVSQGARDNNDGPGTGGDRDTAFTESLPRPRGKKPLMYGLLVILLGVGAMVGYHYWQYATSHVSTDDAALTTNVVQIAPQVSGMVQQVLVKDNQLVKAGDLLVVLNDDTFIAAVAQAQANLDAAIAQARGAGVTVELTNETGHAQIKQAQAGIDQADSTIDSAQADIARVDAGVASAQATASTSQANIQGALAAMTNAKVGRLRAETAVKTAEAQVTTTKANVRSAQANIRSFQANLTAAKATAENAEREAKRYATLRDKGAVSAQLADQKASAATSARAQVDFVQQQIESAQQQAEATEAQVNARMADVEAARQQISSADATIAQAQAQYEAALQQAQAANASVKQAKSQGIIARKSVDQAKARREQAGGQMDLAKTAPRQVAVTRTAKEQAMAKIEQARAALESARIQLNNTRIYAPVSGMVSKKTVEVGALVQPGTPLMAVVQRDQLWVTANYKETQVGEIHPGETADITVDALPGHRFVGHVDSVAAATGATFALIPADNATGNFTKVVQRIPVKLVLNADQPFADRLRAGMSVTVAVKIR